LNFDEWIGSGTCTCCGSIGDRYRPLPATFGTIFASYMPAAIALAFAAGGFAACDPATLAAADVNADGRVTFLDALMILQAAGGAIEL